MPTLVEQVQALATRLGQDIKALRAGKADDSAAVHKTGDETVAGIKTFSSAPVVPVGGADANPVRRDDTRLAADQAAGTASVRTLGSGAQQAAAGNHSHPGGGASGLFWGSVRSGYWYIRPFSAPTTNTPSVGVLSLVPWYFDAAVSITALGFRTNAATASRAVRIGVYGGGTGGVPGPLLFDSGSIAATTNSTFSANYSTTFGPGVVYIGAVHQGASGSCYCESTSPPAVFYPLSTYATLGSASAAGVSTQQFMMSGVTGALPTTFVPAANFDPALSVQIRVA